MSSLWQSLVELPNDAFKSAVALLWLLIGVAVVALVWPQLPRIGPLHSLRPKEEQAVLA